MIWSWNKSFGPTSELRRELRPGSQDEVKEAPCEMLLFMHPNAASVRTERWQEVTFMTDEGNPVHIKPFIWQEWKVARQLNDILIVFYLQV